MNPIISDREYEELKRKADAYDDDSAAIRKIAIWATTGIVVVVLFFVGLFLAWRWITPGINLHKAEIENQRVISQQKAESDAAVYAARSTVTQSKAKAEAEVERAKGAAQAQAIIADTLTEPYLRYLYITNLGTSEHEVIYLPTEAGLPILEAGRFHNEPAATATP